MTISYDSSFINGRSLGGTGKLRRNCTFRCRCLWRATHDPSPGSAPDDKNAPAKLGLETSHATSEIGGDGIALVPRCSYLCPSPNLTIGTDRNASAPRTHVESFGA